MKYTKNLIAIIIILRNKILFLTKSSFLNKILQHLIFNIMKTKKMGIYLKLIKL